jgi:hypothetical protein
MLKRWFAKCEAWARAIEGLDDPHGEYLARLEERIRRLEEEVKYLRAHLASPDAR